MVADLTAPQPPAKPDSRPTRVFDFLVVGAARSGTTSLWRGLDSHPQIRLPSDKEREFFSSNERYRQGVRRYMDRTFAGAQEDQVLGTVTPQLMQPDSRALETIVGRIAATCPEVKIIALLRDPVERGISQFRRMKKMGQGKEETFDAYLQRLVKKRGKLNKVPLVRAGDYGRILKPYFDQFDRDRIKVFFTADLDSEPTAVYQRIFGFLGVDPEHSPETPRIHVGGTRQLVTPAALEELVAELDRIGAFSSSNEDIRRGFVWWLRHLWNCDPDQAGKQISDRLRRTLSRRYLADAEILLELGIEPPWLDDLRAAAA
ncbi:MAG TPA: sulfotransferase [Solirubrobacterales bacterium]